MKIFVGRYFLGNEIVEVRADTEMLGATATVPGEWRNQGRVEIGQVVVGIRAPRWSEILEHVLHEGFEYLAAKADCRYRADLDISNDSSKCLFAINHAQFTQIIGALAEFISPMQNHLARIHRAHHAKLNRKKRR